MTLKLSGSFKIPSGSFKAGDLSLIDAGAHRYWRVNGVPDAGSNDLDIIEIEMFEETSGGSDVTSTSFAIADSELDSRFLKENAFNDVINKSNVGASGNRWSSVRNDGQGWVGQDFGAGNEKNIKRVNLINGWRPPGYPADKPAGSGWQVQYSDDGTTWTDIGPLTPASAFEDVEVLLVAPPAPTLTPTTWDPVGSASNWTLSNGNLTAAHTNVGGSFGYVETVDSFSSGKFYFEITDDNSVDSAPSIGITDYTGPNTPTTNLFGAQPGNNTTAVYGPDGVCYFESGSAACFPSGWTSGDVIGVALDLDNNAIWFSKNGVWGGGASQAEIEAGNTTNAIRTGLTGTYQVVITDSTGDSAVHQHTANFGQNAFSYTVPAGFTAGLGTVS